MRAAGAQSVCPLAPRQGTTLRHRHREKVMTYQLHRRQPSDQESVGTRHLGASHRTLQPRIVVSSSFRVRSPRQSVKFTRHRDRLAALDGSPKHRTSQVGRTIHKTCHTPAKASLKIHHPSTLSLPVCTVSPDAREKSLS